MRIAFLEANLHGEFRANMGLAVLISFIKQKTSHEVDLLDVTFHRRRWAKYIKKKILKFKPQVLGVSSLSFNFYDSLQITAFIKNYFPDIIVIYGGIHPILYPEETLRIKFIDAVVIGEGEYILKEMLDRLEKEYDIDVFKGINGVYYKKNGIVYKNKKAKFIEDLEDLPFIDWKLFEYEKYRVINPYEIGMLSSRGCPFNCTYCVNQYLKGISTGKYVRFKKPETIIKEMKYHAKVLNFGTSDLEKIKNKYPKGVPYNKLKYRYFYLWDNMFNLNIDFVKDFCSKFISARLNRHFTWSCSSRIDLMDKERAEILHNANLNMTRMGVEAGSDYIRQKIYLKNFSYKDVIKVMDLLHKYKITAQTDYIIGGPKENEKDILKSFALIKATNPSQISLNIFQPYPFLKATEIFIEDGGKIDDKGWLNIHSFFQKSPTIHNRISYRKLKSLQMKINLYYLIRITYKYFKKQKIRFLWDILKFVLFYQWRYNFLIHDLFKFTIRKYIYEENLENPIIL